MNFSGWFLVNILAPVLLPVLGTLPLLLFVHRLPVPSGGELLISAVKDGQLCWATIAMCVSTIYNLWLAPGVVRFGGPALVGSLVLMLPSMVIAAGGAVFSTPLRAASGVGAPTWASHYRVLIASAVLAVFAAADHTYVHLAIGS